MISSCLSLRSAAACRGLSRFSMVTSGRFRVFAGRYLLYPFARYRGHSPGKVPGAEGTIGIRPSAAERDLHDPDDDEDGRGCQVDVHRRHSTRLASDIWTGASIASGGIRQFSLIILRSAGRSADRAARPERPRQARTVRNPPVSSAAPAHAAKMPRICPVETRPKTTEIIRTADSTTSTPTTIPAA